MCDKFTQDIMYQILSQSVRFYRLYIKKIGVFRFTLQILISTVLSQIYVTIVLHKFQSFVQCTTMCDRSRLISKYFEHGHVTSFIFVICHPPKQFHFLVNYFDDVVTITFDRRRQYRHDPAGRHYCCADIAERQKLERSKQAYN